MKPSKSFERQIHRVYEFLEGSGVQVTWDDRIPDPDNPSQPRQIDITIERDGKLTLVECRHHRSRQNVKWIEEMMGRRVSLKADSAIAVSSSSFTSGALNRLRNTASSLAIFANLPSGKSLDGADGLLSHFTSTSILSWNSRFTWNAKAFLRWTWPFFNRGSRPIRSRNHFSMPPRSNLAR